MSAALDQTNPPQASPSSTSSHLCDEQTTIETNSNPNQIGEGLISSSSSTNEKEKENENNSNSMGTGKENQSTCNEDIHSSLPEDQPMDIDENHSPIDCKPQSIPHSNSTEKDSTTTLDENPIPVKKFNDRWFDLQFHSNGMIKKPNELEEEIDDPPLIEQFDETLFKRISGSIFGMAIGDALGAHVEFRPRHYLKDHPVQDLSSGGTWGLEIGQFTDDTSMALCLANSLIACGDFVPYDQLVRYKWWYRHGYMSSTGQCFDIGAATSQSLREFQRRQTKFLKTNPISMERLDSTSDENIIKDIGVYCSEDEVAGNGALMRLAPVPLFFFSNPLKAVEFSGQSGQITHGDVKAYDACRYYGALIVAALQGNPKDQILDDLFYSKHEKWFGEKKLHEDIFSISRGSYKKSEGYDGGIRGGGYIVKALEAALWAFWSTNDFKSGALAAVNLGDDTDTTAAIYGQLAGAFYGYDQLHQQWSEKVYAKKFLMKISRWIYFQGFQWAKKGGK